MTFKLPKDLQKRTHYLDRVAPFMGKNMELLKPFLQKDIFALKNLEGH